MHTARRWLAILWWIACPGFAGVVAAFVRDRACFDRTYLLPGISTHPTLATIVGGIYVAGYAWIVGAYALTVVETGRLLPSIPAARQAWGATWVRVAIMGLLFCLDNAPAAIWMRLARVLGCRT